MFNVRVVENVLELSSLRASAISLTKRPSDCSELGESEDPLDEREVMVVRV